MSRHSTDSIHLLLLQSFLSNFRAQCGPAVKKFATPPPKRYKLTSYTSPRLTRCFPRSLFTVAILQTDKQTPAQLHFSLWASGRRKYSPFLPASFFLIIAIPLFPLPLPASCQRLKNNNNNKNDEEEGPNERKHGEVRLNKRATGDRRRKKQTTKRQRNESGDILTGT